MSIGAYSLEEVQQQQQGNDIAQVFGNSSGTSSGISTNKNAIYLVWSPRKKRFQILFFYEKRMRINKKKKKKNANSIKLILPWIKCIRTEPAIILTVWC